MRIEGQTEMTIFAGSRFVFACLVGHFYSNKNIVTSFGLKTEVDEIQRDKNYAEHKLVG